MWLIRSEVTNEDYLSSLSMNSKREEVILDSVVFLSQFLWEKKNPTA